MFCGTPLLLMHLIQERVFRNGAGARIGNGGADVPDRSTVGAIECQLAFCAAAVRFQLIVQFVGGFNDGCSVQGKTVLLSQSRQDRTAGRARVRGVHRVPEEGIDPHPKQIVAEVAERAVALSRAATVPLGCVHTVGSLLMQLLSLPSMALRLVANRQS